MKKKILNALLMGVLVMTSMSVFVSCSDDYDDDIDALKLEQADLLSKLTSLQTSVESQTSSITSQITSLQSSVSSLNSDLQGAISDAASAAQEAGAAATAAATAQSTADGAATAAAAAQATATEALEKAQQALERASDTAAGEALTKAESALTQITELSNKLGSLETLNNGIAGLVDQVNKAATKDELKELSDIVDKYQNRFDNLFAMVTSVELYGTFNGSNAKLMADGFEPLDLWQGKIKENSTFGDKEGYGESDPLKNYKKGDGITSEAGIIVRVNPVNATLSKDDPNCKILLVNSKGEVLDDYLEIADVKKYDALITHSHTRATDINSGLWQVFVKFVDGVDMNEFENAIVDGKRTDGKDDAGNKTVTTNYKLFAVAVNNTDTTQSDRYVASTFDLALDHYDYTPVDELNYTVSNSRGKVYGTKSGMKDSEGVLKNRYDNDVAAEYKWLNDVPATKKITEGTKNVEDDSEDNRNSAAYNLLPVEQGSEFTIALDNPEGKIEYYYVTLDKDFATEGTAPSEWAAWSSYGYNNNLLKTVKASEKLTLKVTSETLDLNGEEIGFRVYAVNYDGTLVDPDGKAFYVQVGTAAGEGEADGTITASELSEDENGNTVNNNSVILDLEGTFNKWTSGEFSGNLDIDDDNSSAYDTNNGVISYQLLDKNKKEIKSTTVATDHENGWKDAKYVKITLNDPGYFEDGGTFVATKTVKDANDKYINTLTVTVTKSMPTDIPTTLSFKAGQVLNGVYTCYLYADDWKGDNQKGKMDLTNVVNGLTMPNYVWTVADAKWNKDHDEELSVTSTTLSDKTLTYPLSVESRYIDAETEHATTVEYNYTGISYVKGKGEWLAQQDYSVPAKSFGCNTIFSCILDKSVHHITGWNPEDITDKDGNVTGHKDVNFATWSESKSIPTKYLAVKNDIDGRYSKWDSSKYKTVKFTLISDETQTENDYFTVTESNGNFVFTKTANESNPKVNVPSTLKIECSDAFGHTMTYTVPFTVYKK